MTSLFRTNPPRSILQSTYVHLSLFTVYPGPIPISFFPLECNTVIGFEKNFLLDEIDGVIACESPR